YRRPGGAGDAGAGRVLSVLSELRDDGGHDRLTSMQGWVVQGRPGALPRRAARLFSHLYSNTFARTVNGAFRCSRTRDADGRPERSFRAKVPVRCCPVMRTGVPA